jgi:hypothetical protein
VLTNQSSASVPCPTHAISWIWTSPIQCMIRGKNSHLSLHLRLLRIDANCFANSRQVVKFPNAVCCADCKSVVSQRAPYVRGLSKRTQHRTFEDSAPHVRGLSTARPRTQHRTSEDSAPHVRGLRTARPRTQARTQVPQNGSKTGGNGQTGSTGKSVTAAALAKTARIGREQKTELAPMKSFI